ncbi:MAG: hypothetical protein GY703_14990 [Gammaproteobacteria bacterium]|nr:hypothetical protein [Gammaproteobacteria bacterium]
MAKTFVINPTDDTQVPFLRGILTRSLHEAGLDFEDAYKLASSIRQDLNETSELSTTELSTLVAVRLQKSYGQEIIEAYQASGRIPATILVKDREGAITPFSQTQHLLCLESCGLSTKSATEASARIYRHLVENEILEISSSNLGRMTYECLSEHFSPAIARRYMVWIDYTHSNRPLILLIGGTGGCGKSTIATEVAHRLGVVRTQSTDMLREVMRMMIPERLLPVLHTSSFDAWEVLPLQTFEKPTQEDLIASGYYRQMELLSVPCEAVIQRALTERVSLILEGVHVHPSLIDFIGKEHDAVVVPIMLAVLRQETLQKRLKGRGQTAPQRAGKRYLSKFNRIWALQSFLLSEADRSSIPIIANDDKEKATIQIMSTIIDALGKQSTAVPEEVFADDR